MSEFNFTEKDLKPFEDWKAEKDIDENNSEEWEIAHFLDGFNFGKEAVNRKAKKQQKLIEMMDELIEGVFYEDRDVNIHNARQLQQSEEYREYFKKINE